DEGTVDLEAEEIEEQKPQGEESARWEQRVLSKLEEADKFTPEEEQKMRDISTEQAKTTAEFEGSSYDIDGKNMIGTENTSVSIFPEFTQTVDGEVTPEQIEAYRRQHDDLLRDNPDMVVGTWYDKKTGQTYLDISILVPNSNNEHVRTLANKYGQKAIFNLQDIKERDSYGHGEVMTMEESIEDRINEARQKDFTPEQKANFKKVNKAMDAADNIMKAVRSVDEKVNMTMHPTQSAFEKAYVKSALEGDKNLTPEQAMMDAKETKAFYDPNTKMIHIDLERFQTSDNDMMHEGVHPILNVINGINPKMIDTLYDQVVSMERRIGKRGLFKKGEVTEEFASQYDEDQQKMEAITEFIARVANNQYDLNNITVFAKIKDFFNNLLSSIGIGQKVRTEQELIDLANQIKEGFETGEEISLNEELFDNPDMANEFLQPGSLVDGTHKLQRSLIGKAKVKGFDTKPLTQREGMSYPKAENIEKVLEKSGGAAIFINSDATKVGEAIVNGRRIVIDGGIDYTYIKKNVDDGIGFAASDDAKIAILMNTAKQIVEKRDKLHPEHKGKPIAVFVTAQSGKAMLGEWYASEYIMEGLDIALSKGVYEGGLDAAKADFKKAILSVKLGKKEAGIFDERSKKKVVEMIDNGKFDTHEGRLEIARELASKDFSFGFRVNFNKVLIPLSNTISGSNQSIKKALYDSGHSLIDFWNKFMDERFLNYINEATTKNSDKSNAVGGKTISGFYYNHTTPIEEQFKHAKKGIQHAQFNSSFKSEGNFLLDAAYDVNEMFPEMAFPTERGIASYNKANKTNISKKNLTHNDKLDITNWLLENVDEDTLYKHKKNLIVKPYTSIAGSMYTGLTTKKHKIQPKKSKVNLLE
ncbi:MAG TPA: hypothetical protein VIS27_03710, partial [Yeosuana sp.]